MRKFIFIAAVALLGTIGLSACNDNDNGNGEQSAQADVSRPSATAVDDAIKECRAKHPESAAPAASGTAAPASGQTAAPASGQTAPEIAAPAPADDDPCLRTTIAATTWQPYLQHVVTSNMGDITNTPYAYFVPSGKYPENQGAISRTQDQVNTVVAATVLPGNMIAVGGPDSATSAQVLISAFQNAAAGSFKGVVVLFIGDQADEAAVQKALAPSGATFKFVQM